MNTSTIISMILIVGIVVGGFGYFLFKAMHHEKKKNG